MNVFKFLTFGIISFALASGCLTDTNNEPHDDENKQFIRIIASPQTGFSPLNVSFSVQLNEPHLQISSYKWDFNDGSISNSIAPTHQFSIPGDYFITVTVNSTEGTIISDTKLIQVYEKNNFYGVWHYLSGLEYYDTLILNPNGTLSLKFSDTRETHHGTYQIFDNSIKFDIPQVHHFPSFYYDITEIHILSLTSIREQETSFFIKERLTENTLYVGGLGPHNYSKIQEAIDDAWYGDTIVVYQGIYSENIKITKSINLVGENRNNTIIDGTNTGHVIEVRSDNVSINNFTIRNSHFLDPHAGIKIALSEGVYCENCVIENNYYGIWLYASSRNVIINSTITLNKFDGVIVHEVSRENRFSRCIISKNSGNGLIFCCGSNFNVITNCTISFNNNTGISIPTSGNILYLNKFLGNSVNAIGYGINYWDNGYHGNYWSDFDEPHEGAYDSNDDGIVDSPYTRIGGNSQDHYPLMTP